MFSNHVANPQGNPPLHLQPGISAHSQSCADTSQFHAISSKTNALTRHQHFLLYSHIIHALLLADECELSMLKSIRQRARSPLFRQFFGNVYYTPPQEIFCLILQIRADKSWDTMKQEVLMQVNNARPHSESPITNLPRSSHACTGPASIPTYTRSRGDPFHPPLGPQQTQPGFVTQHPGRVAGGPSRTAGSPSSTEDHSTTANLGRTAPPGQRFFCPSKNCKKNYARQGHYENHLERCHAEIGPHNPADSLRIVYSTGQPSADDMNEQGRARTARGTTAPTVSQPVLATSMPPSSIPSPPSPYSVASFTLLSGTSPQISLPQKRPRDTEMLSPGLPRHFHNNWDFNPFVSEQQLLVTPPRQPNSNSNQSFFSTDSHLGS
ncbi:hypothetical protein Z517_05632 [Fonsecaea pedrosoi CBS 271.37]|uniref:C2H2-type domain-containing protein n=1 Tax=Fonsecaea pedrosoi CBS 271.37 TaxID=1442368 RepID=A0A0D2GVH8_9EURO|nr:uncharacterized protein Z517_05632 [Fonsecaea pedrosoi CBS 271.37]KIW82605.1 hypothetical protein Z517_05632 [Fonsecaea pedrosoi CBS 271.37]